MRPLLVAALVAVAGCYVDGGIGATTPVHGPATDGARNLLSGDVGLGSGAFLPSGGFDLGFSGQRVPTGSERNGFGAFGRGVFALGGSGWLRGTVRASFAFVPGGDESDEPLARSYKLSLGTLAQVNQPEDGVITAGGPALCVQYVDLAGVGHSFFVGLELSAIIGGDIITWSDSDPDDV